MLSSRIKNKLLKNITCLFLEEILIFIDLCALSEFFFIYVKQGSITVSWMEIMFYVYYLLSLRYTSRLLENFVD